MREQLQLREGQVEEMRAHVDSCLPDESCGLLAGRGDVVEWVLPIANQERSPTRFRMHAREQLRGFRAIEDAGLELVGIFHSHPADLGSQADTMMGPSITDIREAAYPVVQVIWVRRHGLWSARGFWIEDGRVSPVVLQVQTGE